jgi:hypothetical protein
MEGDNMFTKSALNSGCGYTKGSKEDDSGQTLLA